MPHVAGFGVARVHEDGDSFSGDCRPGTRGEGRPGTRGEGRRNLREGPCAAGPFAAGSIPVCWQAPPPANEARGAADRLFCTEL